MRHLIGIQREAEVVGLGAAVARRIDHLGVVAVGRVVGQSGIRVGPGPYAALELNLGHTNVLDYAILGAEHVHLLGTAQRGRDRTVQGRRVIVGGATIGDRPRHITCVVDCVGQHHGLRRCRQVNVDHVGRRHRTRVARTIHHLRGVAVHLAVNQVVVFVSPGGARYNRHSDLHAITQNFHALTSRQRLRDGAAERRIGIVGVAIVGYHTGDRFDVVGDRGDHCSSRRAKQLQGHAVRVGVAAGVASGIFHTRFVLVGVLVCQARIVDEAPAGAVDRGVANLLAIAVNHQDFVLLQTRRQRTFQLRLRVVGAATVGHIANTRGNIIVDGADDHRLRRRRGVDVQREGFGDRTTVARGILHSSAVGVGLAVLQTAVLETPVRTSNSRLADYRAIAQHHDFLARLEHIGNRALQLRRGVVGVAVVGNLANHRRHVVVHIQDRRRLRRSNGVHGEHERIRLRSFVTRRIDVGELEAVLLVVQVAGRRVLPLAVRIRRHGVYQHTVVVDVDFAVGLGARTAEVRLRIVGAATIGDRTGDRGHVVNHAVQRRRVGRCAGVHDEAEVAADRALVTCLIFHANGVGVGMTIHQTGILEAPDLAIGTQARGTQTYPIAVHRHHFACTQRTTYRAVELRMWVVGGRTTQEVTRLRRYIVGVADDRSCRRGRNDIGVSNGCRWADVTRSIFSSDLNLTAFYRRRDTDAVVALGIGGG